MGSGWLREHLRLDVILHSDDVEVGGLFFFNAIKRVLPEMSAGVETDTSAALHELNLQPCESRSFA